MNAAELAHFRALLQQQVPAPKPPARSLFERMRGRLRLVERVDAPASAEPLTLETRAASAPAVVAPDWSDGPAPAAPPPRSPPRFGRREAETPDPAVEDATCDDAQARVALGGAPDADARPLRRRPLDPDAFSTPDEPPPPPVSAPTPGVIAGWSRVRPPSAQRRILSRLEAVFLAEQQGLDARRLAAEPMDAA